MIFAFFYNIIHASKILAFKSTCTKNFQDVQTGFRKGREIRDQIANILWIIEKARKFQKKIYFCFIDNTMAFDYVDHSTLENS